MIDKLKDKKILAIGPHPDDLEIGCFGTLARLSKDNKVFLLILTNGERKDSNGIRKKEAQNSADLINAKLIFCDFKDGFIRDDQNCVNSIEKHINEINPDIIFTINGNDTNQDHRYCFNATISASRQKENVLIYESGSGISFEPNLFVDITKFMDIKIKAVLEHKTQFNEIVEQPIKGQAKIYGFKLRKPDKYFEAFKIWKCIL